MNWLIRKLSAPRRAGDDRTRKPTTQLVFETLEDRCVPTVNYYGGALLTNVEAQAVFLGSAWNTGTSASQKATLDGFVNYLVNSPYTQALTQAGYGVSSGTATAGVVDPASLPAGTSLTDAQIQADLQALIGSGAVAAPDANRLYVIYVQPDVVVSQGGTTSQQGLLGYHGAFAGHTAAGQAIDIHYAVVAYPGGSVGNQSNTANALDDLTSVSSHEIAEAVTDPNVGYKTLGWYDPYRGEIGDITQQYLTHLNGYLVQEVAGKNDRPLALTGTIGQPTQPTQPTGLTATQTTLSASAGQISVGQGVALTLTVTPAAGSVAPTGVVTLMDGNQVLGRVNLSSSGPVVVDLYANSGSVGTHTLTAVYAGNGAFQGSISSTITLTVLPPPIIPIWTWVFYWKHPY